MSGLFFACTSASGLIPEWEVVPGLRPAAMAPAWVNRGCHRHTIHPHLHTARLPSRCFPWRGQELRVGGPKSGSGHQGTTLQPTSTQSQVSSELTLPHPTSVSWAAFRANQRSWYLPGLLQCLTQRLVPWLPNSAPGAGRSAAGSSAQRQRSASAQAPQGPLGWAQTAPAA